LAARGTVDRGAAHDSVSLCAALVAFIMLRSAWRGGRIEWRGRTYSSS